MFTFKNLPKYWLKENIYFKIRKINTYNSSSRSIFLVDPIYLIKFDYEVISHIYQVSHDLLTKIFRLMYTKFKMLSFTYGVNFVMLKNIQSYLLNSKCYHLLMIIKH